MELAINPGYTVSPSVIYTANSFSFMYFQKRFSQASLLISKLNIYRTDLYMYYSVSIGNNIFPQQDCVISVVQDIHTYFQIRTTKMVSWILISFSKVYCIFGIWHWGLANTFLSHVIQISIKQKHFHNIFSQLWKVKIFCGYIHSLYVIK